MTRAIVLTKGFVAIIDDEDYELVSQYKWHTNIARGKAYASTWIKDDASIRGKKRLYLHSLLGPQDGDVVDHIDNNTMNNTRANLRSGTFAQNCHNRKKPENNTSGVKGVAWRKDVNKYQAYISIQGKRLHLGYFNTLEDAANARLQAAQEHHGEFMRIE